MFINLELKIELLGFRLSISNEAPWKEKFIPLVPFVMIELDWGAATVEEKTGVYGY